MAHIKTKLLLVFLISVAFLGYYQNAYSATIFDTNLNSTISVKYTDVVKSLQQFLTEQGIYSGPINGSFLKTKSAIIDFQKKYNLPPTGFYGPMTRAKVKEIYNSPKATTIVQDVKSTISDYIPNTLYAVSRTVSTVSNPFDSYSNTDVGKKITSLYDQVRVLEKKISEMSQGGGNNSGGVPSSTIQTPTLAPTIMATPTSTPTPTISTVPSPVATPTSIPTPTKVPTPTPTSTLTPTPTPTPTISTTPTPSPTSTPVSKKMLWGAYVGDSKADLGVFETLVGKQVNIRSVFYGFSDNFPLQYSTTIGQTGKTLLLFWEPSFGYDQINDGSHDAVIKKFASDAKAYGYPVILSPFHEMNGNWSPWGYGINGNTPAKFIAAWKRIKDLFIDVPNVKFALVYNSVSKPNITGNQIVDYYPGDAYVDYVGVDGFNFGNPWLSFQSVFSDSLSKLSSYNKPIYIFSMGSTVGSEKANWIKDALGVQVYKYPQIVGWVWFNQNSYDGNWLVDSDPASLSAFKDVLPK